MDLNFSDEDFAFQMEVRNWIKDNYPAEMKARKQRSPGGHLSKEDHVYWQKALNTKGWVAPGWPVEHGGSNFTPSQRYLFDLEMAHADTPAIIPFGLGMVAPVIMKYGTEEQKAKYLPDILDTNVWWCQGYSEPGAGSDLASLRTKAVRQGDHYIVNGTKTWNTMGQYADMIFCLVRTDVDVKQQEGISFLLIDMNTPGIEVRPIVLLDGGAEVNEVWFTDVKVPKANRIGEDGFGFKFAMKTLSGGRIGIAAQALGIASGAYELALQYSKQRKAFGTQICNHQAIAFKLAEMATDIEAARHMVMKAAWEKDQGINYDTSSAMAKLFASRIAMKHTVEAVQIHGGNGFVKDYHVERLMRDAKITQIYEGTSEIQKMVISRSILKN